MQDVDGAVGIDAGCDHFFNLVGLGDVAAMGDAVVALFRNGLTGFLDRLFVEVGGKDFCAFASEQRRRRTSVTPARSARSRACD
jgi:hypothetical protein